MVYADPVDGADTFEPEEIAQVHEYFHVWSLCIFGNADFNHTRVNVWNTAINAARATNATPAR